MNASTTIITNPTHKLLKTVPATFKTITERVLINEEDKVLTVVLAKWGTETVTDVSKAGGNSLQVIPAAFSPSIQTLEIKSAYA